MKHFVAVFLFLFSIQSFACSCLPRSDAEAFDKSSAVYLAKVTDTTLYEDPDLGESVYGSFEVLEMFKGDEVKTRVLKSSTTSMCSSLIVSGGYYLIYSDDSEYERINVCSVSRRVAGKEEEELLVKYRGKQ
jgi:hypothetical protein